MVELEFVDWPRTIDRPETFFARTGGVPEEARSVDARTKDLFRAKASTRDAAALVPFYDRFRRPVIHRKDSIVAVGRAAVFDSREMRSALHVTEVLTVLVSNFRAIRLSGPEGDPLFDRDGSGRCGLAQVDHPFFSIFQSHRTQVVPRGTLVFNGHTRAGRKVDLNRP